MNIGTSMPSPKTKNNTAVTDLSHVHLTCGEVSLRYVTCRLVLNVTLLCNQHFHTAHTTLHHTVLSSSTHHGHWLTGFNLCTAVHLYTCTLSITGLIAGHKARVSMESYSYSYIQVSQSYNYKLLRSGQFMKTWRPVGLFTSKKFDRDVNEETYREGFL